MDLRYLQIEVRYNHLLDFKEIYKPLVAPLVGLKDSKFEISNPNLFDEYIVITVNKEFQIDFRMDRLIFRYEGILDGIFSGTGHTQFFFDILNELIGIDTFNNFAQTYILMRCVKRMPELSFEELRNTFKDKFMRNVDKVFSKEPTDMAITVEHVDGTKRDLLSLGPYNGASDFEKHLISPLKSDYNLELLHSEDQGYFCTAQYNGHDAKPTKGKIKEKAEIMLSEINSII